MNQPRPEYESRHRFSIAYLLYGLIFLALVLEGGFGQSFLYLNLNNFAQGRVDTAREVLLEKEKANMANLTGAPLAILERYYRESSSTEEVEQVIDVLETQIASIWEDDSNNSTDAQKRAQILELVSRTRFGTDNTNYIWANDRYTVLSHPNRAVIGIAINDSSLYDRRDNKPFLPVMVDMCLVADPQTNRPVGEARLEYYWPKANQEQPLAKMSYMRYLPEVGMFLGGGVYVEDTAADKMTEALAAIRNFRLPDGTYFWVQDTSYFMRMHPVSPELENRNLENVTDHAGNPFFTTIVDLCMEQGGGYIDYWWGRPDDPDGSYHKLSYVKLFEPWGLIVGTGIYIDDIDAASQAQSKDFMQVVRGVIWRTMIYGLVAMLGIFLIVGFAVKATITRPIKALCDSAAAVAGGDLEPPRLRARFMGELAVLRDAFAAMVERLRAKVMESERNSQDADRAAQEASEALEEAEAARRHSQAVEEFQRHEVERLSEILARMAKGDLTEIYAVSGSDEDQSQARETFRSIQEGVNATIDKLSSMIMEIHKHSRTLFESADAFKSLSGKLAMAAAEMSDQAGNVAGATEEMSTNVNTMASSAEQMNVNVASVSGTTEEMSQAVNSITESMSRMTESFSQVSDSAQDGSRVAAEAMEMVSKATNTMSTLGEAANEIGKVTEVIKRIAEQTNLLALNATIEAASAGDAGKGFAVVANEIKELANQSAKSAEDISEKIAGVQDNTKEAVKDIGDVVSIISAIHGSVNDISSAVDEQMKAANDISGTMKQANVGISDIASSMGELSKGANDMSRNIGEFAKALNEVANNILSVSRAVEANKGDAKLIETSAKQILKVSGRLLSMTKRFKMPQ